jgi:hypothetical protein
MCKVGLQDLAPGLTSCVLASTQPSFFCFFCSELLSFCAGTLCAHATAFALLLHPGGWSARPPWGR